MSPVIFTSMTQHNLSILYLFIYSERDTDVHVILFFFVVAKNTGKFFCVEMFPFFTSDQFSKLSLLFSLWSLRGLWIPSCNLIECNCYGNF